MIMRGMALVATVVMIGAEGPASAQTRAPGSDALKQQIERRFDVLPLHNGLALHPKSPMRADRSVRSIELTDHTIAVDGTPVTGVELRDKLGDDALDVSLLEREVSAYDATIARGKPLFNDDQLRRIAQLRSWRGDRLRTCKFQRVVDERAMPLIAIRMTVEIKANSPPHIVPQNNIAGPNGTRPTRSPWRFRPGPTSLRRPPMCALGSRRSVPPTTVTSLRTSACGPSSTSPPTTITSPFTSP